MSSAYSNSPHYSTPGLRFFGTSALRKSIIFPQACFLAVSFCRRRLGTQSLRNRIRTGTPIAQSERPVPGTSSDGTGEARRTPYRPSAPGPCPFPQFRYVVRLEFSGSFGPMQTWRRAPMPRSAQWIVHNTNHWGAVSPNMIPGKIRAPTLTAHGTQVGRWPPPAWFRTSGSSKTFPPSYDHIEKELTLAMERNWIRADRPQFLQLTSCPHTLARSARNH